MRKYIDAIGGRKVMFGLILLIVGVAVTLYLKDLPQNLMILMSFIGTTFFLANGVEHIAGRSIKNSLATTDTVTTPQFQAFVSSLDSVLAAQDANIAELKKSGDKLATATESGSKALKELIIMIGSK